MTQEYCEASQTLNGTNGPSVLEMDSLVEDKGNQDDDVTDRGKKKKLLYDVDEKPPVILSIFLAFQHLSTVLTSGLIMSLIVADATCIPEGDPMRTQIFSATFLMAGVATVAQTAFGIRLPILQGPNSVFISVLYTLKSSPSWQCSYVAQGNDTHNSTQEDTTYWRFQKLQGSIMIGAFVEVLLGVTGLVGLFTRWISPLSLAVMFTTLGVSLVQIPMEMCSASWPIAILAMAIVVICSCYLEKVQVNIPVPNLKSKKTTKVQLPIFKILAFLIGLLICWSVSGILTAANVFSNDPTEASYRARTDIKLDLIHKAPWLTLPYPGQFGTPSISTAAVIGIIVTFLLSAMESVGDYMAVSACVGHYPPPTHAINRGIAIEGLVSILSGAMGTGHATSSYTGNIGIIHFTKVGSRIVLVFAGIALMILSLFGKLSAVLTIIPDPVLGGLILPLFGYFLNVSVTLLQNTDMSASRNTAVYGFSVYFGVTVANWHAQNSSTIQTGSDELDQVINMVLGSAMLLSVGLAVFLDNTLPGMPKHGNGSRSSEDIIVNVHADEMSTGTNDKDGKIPRDLNHVYRVPYIKKLQEKYKLFRHMPFLQEYVEDN